MQRLGGGHFAVQFKACVDAPPLLVMGSTIYAACQGGIIQRLRVLGVDSFNLSGSYELAGWNIQGDMVAHGEDAVIVCGYDRKAEQSMVVSLSSDLKRVHWSRILSGTVKAGPVEVNGLLYVNAGSDLFFIDADNGTQESSIELPSPSESKPAIVPLGCRDTAVVYAFSHWDSGVAVIRKHNGAKDCDIAVICDITAPVYADVLPIGNERVVIVDTNGCLHVIDVGKLKLEKTIRVSNKPVFSSPILYSSNSIIFGCHDGVVRCFREENLEEQGWRFDANAVVCSKPMSFASTSPVKYMAVCTTAGDIIIVNAKTGEEQRRYTVDGEIWSDPILVSTPDGREHIVVGARDSRVHIIALN